MSFFDTFCIYLEISLYISRSGIADFDDVDFEHYNWNSFPVVY